MSTDVIILILFFVIIVLDIYLYTDDIEGNTFSQRLVILGRKYPSIPAFCGYLIGHWFG